MAQDCEDVTPKMTTYTEALKSILAQARCTLETEEIPVDQALDRVLAADQFSSFNVPPADNSAMDGYAVRIADLASSGETRLKVGQRIPAGEVGRALQTGTAARIFTGAPIPSRTDAVIMQEECRTEGSDIIFEARLTEGENIRLAGEDIKAGTTVLKQGRRLKPQDLGLAASIGISHLPVFKRLRVAILTTGSELREPGESLEPGQIYNSNRYTLRGLLQKLDCEVSDIGIVADDLHSTTEALRESARHADLIISSGGVSVGEEDHVRAALEQLGQVSLWKLAIKPGKPCVFGHVGETPFLGLPGNPVSVFMTFCLLAHPFIVKLQGGTYIPPQEFRVTADFSWPKPGKRLEFLRARLERRETGQFEAAIFPNQSSGVLTSTVWANGVVVIPIGHTIAPGDGVGFIPLNDLVGS